MLQVKNLSVSFYTRNGITQATRNVSFEVQKGETLAIVGESGSGKSISCQTLMGLVPCPPGKIESGSVLLNGEELLSLKGKALRNIRGKKISMVFQDPMTSLNPFMTVGDQIVEAIREHSKLSRSEAKLRAVESLTEVGIINPVERFKSYPHQFSGGMRQRVMIAMALATEPEILIADEPTTALDVTVQAQILELLKDLQKKHQLSIIFISHDLAVVRNIADKVIVMKSGDVVETGEPREIFEQPKHPYTSKLINAIPSSAKPVASNCSDTPLLEIKNLNTHFISKTGPAWNKKISKTVAAENINLSVKQGEILGLVGESGSGKSTLGRSVIGLNSPESGEILYRGKNLLKMSAKEMFAVRPHIQMIFQDPYASLDPRMTVFDTLKEPIKLHTTTAKDDIPKCIDQLLDDVGLPRSAAKKYPHEFSGGQRQRIAIARALACAPELIIADEPVSALDVTIQAQILELLLEISASRNLTMLFISHDLGVVRYLCDRVAVMKHGKIVEVNSCESIFSSPQHPYTSSLLNAIQELPAKPAHITSEESSPAMAFA